MKNKIISVSLVVLLCVLFASAGYIAGKGFGIGKIKNFFKKKQTAAAQEVSGLHASIYPPSITGYYIDANGEPVSLKPDPITFYFNDSAANIEKLDAELTGISMSPDTEGTWKWRNEYELVFIPKNDWPAGEEYKIKLPKNIFAANSKIDEYSYKTQTPKFQAYLNSFQLFQDPQNPKTRQIQAFFSFTHPVDEKSFENNLTLTVDNKRSPFSITYDALKRSATIVSDPVQITSKDRAAVIELTSAKAKTGGKIFKEKIKQELDIPSQDRFFKISSINAVTARNDAGDPEQFIEISFTDGVHFKELDGKIEAYLLPLANPDKGSHSSYIYEYDEDYYDDDGNYIEGQGYNRPYSYKWSFDEVNEETLKKSSKINLERIDGAQDINSSYAYKYKVADMATRYLYVTISEGISSQTDFVIKKPYAHIIKSAAFPKEISLLQNGAILPLAGSKELTFKTRGISKAQVNISRVTPDRINHLISQTYGSFAHPNFKNSYDFNESDISQSFSKIVPLAVSIEKANYSSVDLSEFLKSQGSSGLFFITVKEYDANSNSLNWPYDKRFILATDLGILVKRDNKQKYNVFVISINSGLPVSNAKVEVLGRNGIPILTQYTNEQGCAVFEKIAGYSGEKEPVAFVVTKGNDVSFMPYNRNDRSVNYSKFDVGGEYSNSSTKGLKAFIFSDRGIYRPGDDINFGVITKDDEWSDISGIPVKFVFKDPSGKTLIEKTITLNQSGFFTIDAIKTFNSSPSGTYTADVYITKNNNSDRLIGSAWVRIEEFRTDTIKVTSKILGASAAGWTLTQDLKAAVSAYNLFGTPAQDKLVKSYYSLSPTEFRFSKYSDFRFPDPYRLNGKNSLNTVSDYFADARTDESGESFFIFDLAKYSGGTYNLSFEAEVYEGDSGKGVSSYDSVKVSPYKYLIGYKTDSKLSYLNKGSAASVELIALDNNLKQIQLQNLKLKKLQKQYVSSLVKQNNGIYKYQTVTKETLLEEKPFSVKASVNKIDLDTSSAGEYIIEIEDENGFKILSFSYFIAGESNLSFKIEKDANLMINLQNEDVEPGQQLTLNITAPYTGAGLITIEKDKIYAYKWFKTDSNSSAQKITVPHGIEGNAYVNVSFIRSVNSKEIFSSPHSYAAVPFKISLSKRTLKIDLKAPEILRPGEELEISYKSSQNAKITVYAVDEGILQVAQYKLPNPLSFFFTKNALEVITYQTVDLILPDYKIIKEVAGIGGGEYLDEASAALAKNLNPFSRKTNKPVVFWSAAVDSSTEFQTVKFKVPNYFNGRIRVMAAGASPEKTGSAQTETIVKSPVIISPIAPLAAIRGDTFEVSAAISNNIEGSKAAAIEAWLETNDKFEIISENKFKLEIKEGGEKTIKFTLKTLDNLGSGNLIFKAASGGEVFKSEISVSVRPAYAYRTQINSGFSKKSEFKVDDFARDMYDNFSNREVTASHSPQIIFTALKRYFTAYPYGCTEQIISAAFPFIYGAASDRKGFISPKEQQTLFSETLSRIRNRQQSSGGFSLYTDGYVHVYASIYALHFFTDAKDLGYPVPAEILQRGKTWLENYAAELPSSFDDARMKAYANYVLTRNNFVTTNNLIRIEEYFSRNHKKWEKDIASAYLASCYQMLKDSKKAQSLINSYEPQSKEKFIFYSDFDSSSQRNAVYLYLCNKHFSQNLNADAQSISEGLVKVILDGKYNTISASNILLALLSYGNSLESKDDSIRITATAKDKSEVPLTLKKDPFPYSLFSGSVTAFSIEGAKDSDKIYYAVLQQGFDKTTKEYSNNLEITREFISDNGSPVKNFNMTDSVNVRIRVRTKLNDSISVAVVDLLPACFEIISGTQSGSYDSCDAREDRMIFYAGVSKNITELTYKVKAVTRGTFTLPGIYAAAMYDPEISALTKQSSITVE
ncbi:MAG: alpha-2-macroglobulin [Endomicrobium sp.]|jgi:uncharacterized protein YfaS (alpha-2-macroglobulin family)|nr:alpha-2-macroglobulin [Endomicrobium sp.]